MRMVAGVGEASRMRTAYHQQLADLLRQLGEMCGLAGSAMEHATQALLEADIAAAKRVVSDNERLVAMRIHVEKRRSRCWLCSNR